MRIIIFGFRPGTKQRRMEGLENGALCDMWTTRKPASKMRRGAKTGGLGVAWLVAFLYKKIYKHQPIKTHKLSMCNWLNNRHGRIITLKLNLIASQIHRKRTGEPMVKQSQRSHLKLNQETGTLMTS
ncbi:hypothetical protein HanHA89_Chr05g0203531 [Helianthus annuus]|nr:hypothetical protein HanHA89_Chr05g0203531 [Helianthus annuus]